MSPNRDHLLLRNFTAEAARLRFRHHGHVLWDSWLAAHGQLELPNPRWAEVQASARFVDPATQVAYTAPSLLPSAGGREVSGRLVAQMEMSGNACCFSVQAEAASSPGVVQLLNLTAGEVCFKLHYRQTPFGISVCLPCQSEYGLSLDQIELSATLNGCTTASLPITLWSGEYGIEMFGSAKDYPVIRQGRARA